MARPPLPNASHKPCHWPNAFHKPRKMLLPVASVCILREQSCFDVFVGQLTDAVQATFGHSDWIQVAPDTEALRQLGE